MVDARITIVPERENAVSRGHCAAPKVGAAKCRGFAAYALDTATRSDQDLLVCAGCRHSQPSEGRKAMETGAWRHIDNVVSTLGNLEWQLKSLSKACETPEERLIVDAVLGIIEVLRDKIDNLDKPF